MKKVVSFGTAALLIVAATIGLVGATWVFVYPRLPASQDSGMGDNTAVRSTHSGVSHPMTTGCDDALRSMLESPSSLTTAADVNKTIQALQSQRYDCQQPVWDPKVKLSHDLEAGTEARFNKRFSSTCVSEVGTENRIGQTTIPNTLLRKVDGDTGREETHGAFVRDETGNVLVEFQVPHLPADGSRCWVYTARFDLWDRNR